tara:strand:+ start:14894 stop:16423 length:1530 start_codon:yes stop_codon:yes gene_type:complete
MAINLFGFEISKKISGETSPVVAVSPIPQRDDESSTSIPAGGGYYGQVVDLSNTNVVSDHELIHKYREAAQQPECDAAVSDIVDSAIAASEESGPVAISMIDLELPDKVKTEIIEEFNRVLQLYKFNRNAAEYFRDWYIDGKSYFNVIIDPKNPQRGITEIRQVESTHIKKIKEVSIENDKTTNIEYEKVVDEYYVYSPSLDGGSNLTSGVKFAKDAIIQVNSGLMDGTKTRTIGHLHKAMKLVNQLRYMEDSLVIYRVSRSPERRIFYIDVGNLPKGKAEEYVQQVVSRYRNKLVYDASSGNISDDRRSMSMLEDFYLPRREGGRGTEITTLPGGENLGQIEDVQFFQRKLYRALNVPVARLEQDTAFSVGRASEVSREEVKFQKFVDRLRKKFSFMLMDALRIQLILKGIITESEWGEIEESINVSFLEDNYFAELKEFEILRERLEMSQMLEDVVGKYISDKYVRTVILKQSEEDIMRLDNEIADEAKSEGDGDEEMGDDDDDDLM